MKIVWNGIAKLLEECGELSCVLGKLIAYPLCNHPDEKYSSPLRDRLHQELADVLAACEYFIERNNLDNKMILERKEKKKSLFRSWNMSGVIDDREFNESGVVTSDSGAEQYAKICESMVVGGRAWNEEQAIAAAALLAAAKAIRESVVTEKHGPVCECDQCICDGPTRNDNHFTLIPTVTPEQIREALEQGRQDVKKIRGQQ